MDFDPLDPALESISRYDDFIEGNMPGTLTRHELEYRGHFPPDPAGLSDEAVSQALTELAWALGDLGVVIESADHLSDRELYGQLWEFLDEPNMLFPDDPYSTYHWVGLPDCDEDAFLRYYADEETRVKWRDDFEVDLPPSELPPYPRPWLPGPRYLKLLKEEGEEEE